MVPDTRFQWRRLRGLVRRAWWRVRYGKHIAPGTWSRGSDYGRGSWRQMKAERRRGTEGKP